MPKLPQSPDIGQNSEGCIFNFWISGQIPFKQKFPDSKTSNDIDMKLGPVTKLDKGIREIGLLQELLIITTFHLTKTENRTKKSLTALILLL